ncbi:FHA domain-containing protein [Candidatus Bathyarchaeota archaeon]|nr:FHA domain-containing protein [Candidatus Bathyarchaeota archaeon]
MLTIIDFVLSNTAVSSQHCSLALLWRDNTRTLVELQALSSNGTHVNDVRIKLNHVQELHDGDTIGLSDNLRFIFKIPQSRSPRVFLEHYTLGRKYVGSADEPGGETRHCVKKSTGQEYIVEVYTEESGTTGVGFAHLELRIGTLTRVHHPNLHCLEDTFEDGGKVYLVLGFAQPGNELFNTIIRKAHLTEDQTRVVFAQLFQGVKYLVNTTVPRVGKLPLTFRSKSGASHIAT